MRIKVVILTAVIASVVIVLVSMFLPLYSRSGTQEKASFYRCFISPPPSGSWVELVKPCL